LRLARGNSPVPDLVQPEVYASPCSTITLGAATTSSGAPVATSAEG
jgi:hypothetical protein